MFSADTDRSQATLAETLHLCGQAAMRPRRRWPTRCACGYVFQDDDEWQLFHERIYVRLDTEQEYTLRFRGEDAAPVGAIWEAPWHVDADDPWIGPDGRCLMVRLPPDGHDWCVDGPATSGGRWERTGDAPRLTVRPSILTPKYHGYLTDGVLSDDLEGRTY